MSHRANRGAALTPSDIRALEVTVKELGEPRVIALLGLSRESLARALAGLGVRGVTRAAIVNGLALYKREAGHA